MKKKEIKISYYFTINNSLLFLFFSDLLIYDLLFFNFYKINSK